MSLQRFEKMNLYELLGVPQDASTEEIKTRYKEIARVYHPDSNFYADIVNEPLNAEQLEIFKIVTDAYNTLTNSEQRLKYDQSLRIVAANVDLTGPRYSQEKGTKLQGWDEAGPARVSEHERYVKYTWKNTGRPETQKGFEDENTESVSDTFQRSDYFVMIAKGIVAGLILAAVLISICAVVLK